MQTLYLASTSPRRRELLQTLLPDLRCLSVDVAEVLHPGEAPDAFAKRLAQDKAQAGLAALPSNENGLVIGGRYGCCGR